MFQRLRMFWRRSMVLTDLKISFIPSFPRPILTGVSQVSQVSLEISPFFGISLFFFRFDSRIRPGFEYPRDGIESCLGGCWCQKPILWFLKKWGESIQFHKRYYVSIIFNFAPHLPLTQNFEFSKSFVTACLADPSPPSPFMVDLRFSGFPAMRYGFHKLTRLLTVYCCPYVFHTRLVLDTLVVVDTHDIFPREVVQVADPPQRRQVQWASPNASIATVNATFKK